MNIDFFQLPIWPRDTVDQIDWFNRLKTLLNNMDAIVNAARVYVVTIESAAEPSQSDWETAYTIQTGESLPIPATARLLWWDTTNNRPGGTYGTLTNDATVYPRSGMNSPGSVCVMEHDSLTASHSIDYILGESLVNHPVLEIITVVPVKLQLIYFFNLTYGAGAGTVGADFLLSGVKVGTLYYSLASNRGFGERSDSGLILALAETPTLNPGTYEIQAIAGRTNAATAVGAVAGRYLYVKGIAQ